MVIDPVSDMLIRLKNASAVGKTEVQMPYSKLKLSIAKELVKGGYLISAEKKGKKIAKTLAIELAADDGKRINDVKRISKPSRRIYRGARELHPFVRARGTTYLSTPQGITTAANAAKSNIGGEILFRIW